MIPIAQLDGKLLVAIPLAGWHKKPAKRFFPTGGLQKPVSVEVAASPEFGGAVKLWAGFLAPGLTDSIVVGEPEESGVLDFSAGDVPKSPSPEALVDIAREHFAFVSARSEGSRDVEEDVEGPGAAGRRRAAAQGLSERVSQLEQTLETIQGTLEALPNKLLGKSLGAKAKAAAKKSAAVSPPGGLLPGLDPAVLASARQSSIPEEQLQRLSQLLSKPNRMVEGRARPPRATDVLSETEEEGEAEAAAAAEEAPDPIDQAAGPIEAAVLQLTKLVTTLAKPKPKQTGLEAILDKIDGGNGESVGAETTSGSRSKATAYKKLKATLTENPEWLYQSIEAHMEEDFCLARTAPGMSSTPSSSRAWLEHRSRLLNYTASVRAAWIIGGIHDALRQNNIAQARARSALALAAYDQASLDGGSWQLSQEILLELPPPFSSFASHKPVDTTEQAWSRLVDERVLEPRADYVATPRQGHLPGEQKAVKQQRKREPRKCNSNGKAESAQPTGVEAQGEGKAERQGSTAAGFRRAGGSPRSKLSRGRSAPLHEPQLKDCADVPGAGASTAHAFLLWSQCFETLSRARTPFAAFLHSILTRSAFVEKAPEWKVWPMPLPFPEVHSKARSRKKLDAPRKLGLNFLILLLNWLAVGEMGLADPAIQLGRRLNRQQWEVVSRLSPFVTDWNAQAAVTAKEMGRSAAKVESVEAQVLELEAMLGCHNVGIQTYGRLATSSTEWPGLTGHPGEVVGYSKKVVEHLAKDVDPDRLFFKGVPTFDPVPLLEQVPIHRAFFFLRYVPAGICAFAQSEGPLRTANQVEVFGEAGCEQ